MHSESTLSPTAVDDSGPPQSVVRPIKIAIAALGGQGGGVLAGWMVTVAERAGYLAQSTSVPGVAQRTGATIYYIELFPGAEAERTGRDPVMALMPTAGDVDVVIASELMEAGRSINRQLVSPDRTTLITSTHRIHAISEKSAMGDGLADSGKVLQRARVSAQKLVACDMEALAEQTGSVISSVLFGAVAGAGVLPIARQDFEETIRAGGKAVEVNLAGFEAGFDAARRPPVQVDSGPGEADAVDPWSAASAEGRRLFARLQQRFPPPVHRLAREGVRRVVDYQDPRYGDLYLDRLEEVLAVDSEQQAYRLTREVARYLALWMTYEDVIRVADLKTRASRFERFRQEVHAKPEQIVHVAEFMHPRVEEICDTLPAPLGRWMLRTRWARGFLSLFTRRGRRIPTTKLRGFLLLFLMARLRGMRRHSLRYQAESAKTAAWLERIGQAAPRDYDLAVELAECQRLIKGYGDTHARGSRSYDAIMEYLESVAVRDDAATTIRALREAALKDDKGAALEVALAELRG